MPPLVSVVMGVYNGAAYLSQAVDSVLAQDGVDFEFVIVDDGSTDATPALLRRYAAGDQKIRAFRQDNLGLTRALIRGCSAAQGAYIARQDSDDISMPGRLAKLAALFDAQPETALAFSWVRRIGPAGEPLEEIRPTGGSAEITARFRQECRGIPAHGSTMFRRSAYERAGGYRPEFYYAQDADLWLRLAACGGLGCVPECLYELRVVPESISAVHRDLQAAFAQAALRCHRVRAAGADESLVLQEVESLRQVARSNRERPPSRRSRAVAFTLIGGGLAARQDPRALSYFWRALAADCLLPQAWAGLLRAVTARWRKRPSRPWLQ
jgi:cellulose synthase/poly-beta-1,6-N-acetylglucosamine synthase-like glycosyltransferase